MSTLEEPSRSFVKQLTHCSSQRASSKLVLRYAVNHETHPEGGRFETPKLEVEAGSYLAEG